MEGPLPTKKLLIKTEMSDDMVSITIADTGRGIPASIQHRIMEPFFTTKDVGRGTGLGLSISYGIVEKHNGKLTFVSEENKGTEFRIVFKVTGPIASETGAAHDTM